VVQVPTEWKPELYQSGLANALQANPDANCVFVPSDYTFPSVEAALQEYNKLAAVGDANHIYVASCDLLPQGVEAMQKGYLDVAGTVDCWNMSKTGVEVIAKIMNGETVDSEYLVKGRVVFYNELDKMEHITGLDYLTYNAE
jgi:ABC-type sugar transport system substrate-binding protein